MSDRFDAMAGRVQLEMESYALRASLDGRRRVIADALREAHTLGREEMQRGWDQMKALLDFEKGATTRLIAERDALNAELAEARGALRRIEPFLPALDSGPIRHSEHAQAAGLVRAALAKGGGA